MRRTPAITALSVLLLAACGGQADGPVRRADAVPSLAALAEGAGAAASELRAGRIDAARARYEAVLATDPERLGALNDLAVSYALDGRLDAARALLDEVVAHGTSREQQLALVNLGELYGLDGYPAAAQAHLETARSIDPQRPEPVYALALLADVRGERPQGLALAREAMRLDEAGAARAALTFLHAEERTHLEALLSEARGDRGEALARWRELRGGRFPLLSQAAQRHLDEP